MLHTFINLTISIFCVYGLYSLLCDVFKKVAYEILKQDEKKENDQEKDGEE